MGAQDDISPMGAETLNLHRVDCNWYTYYRDVATKNEMVWHFSHVNNCFYASISYIRRSARNSGVT